MSADGTWQITITTPMGAQKSTLVLASDGGTLTGEQSDDNDTGPIYDGSIAGDELSWTIDIKQPFAMSVQFAGTVDGDRISGRAKAGAFPPMPFTGARA